jgi:hypothetical protein
MQLRQAALNFCGVSKKILTLAEKWGSKRDSNFKFKN